MRLVLLLSAIAGTACAQAISVTSPIANQSVSGTSFQLVVSYSNLPNLYLVEYDVDGELAGISHKAPFSFNWNSYYVSNSTHTVQAIARDGLNNPIVTSSPVTFHVENNLPQQTCATTCTDISVTTGSVTQITTNPSFANANVTMSFKCSSPCSVASGSPKVAGLANSPASVTLSNTITGHAIIGFARWQSSSGTISVSDGRNSYTLVGSPQRCGSSGPCSIQGFYALNITGASSTVVTATASNSVQVALAVYDVANLATSNALDVGLSANGSGTALQSALFNLAQVNEIIFAYGAWQGNPTSVTASSGYSMVVDSSNLDAVEYIVPPTSGWFSLAGLSVTSNGPSSGASKTFALYVDGLNTVSHGAITAATNTLIFDTSAFANIQHQVLVRVDGPNCAGCINGSWTDMGGWEQAVTFSNRAIPSWLQASAHELILCTVAGVNCVTSATVTGTIVNTDGSTNAATIMSCVSNDPTTATVSGTCTVNQVAAGGTFVTMTESGGKTRVFQVYVLPGANVIPHFSNAGKVLTSYNPATSIVHLSQFFTDLPLISPSSYYTTQMFAADYKTAGYNAFEHTFTPTPPQLASGISEASFHSSVQAEVTNICTNIAAVYGLYIHLNAENWLSTTGGLFDTVYGDSASYVTPGWQYFMQQYANCGRVVGLTTVDEVTGVWGINPLQGIGTGGVIIGTNGFTQLTGNGTTSTITCPLCSIIASRKFILTGSGQSTLDYNPGTNAPIFFWTSGSFPSAFNGTITSGTVQFHPYVNNTFDASGNPCSSTSGVLGGGFSSGPCPNWIHYNAFQIVRNWHTAVTNYPAMAWPSRAGSPPEAINEWCGKQSASGLTLADYCEIYWSSSSLGYLPGRLNLSDLQTSQLGTIRTQYPLMNLALPFVVETNGVTVDYAMQGYPVAVTGCNGNTITTAGPHGLLNIQPGATRLWVSGSTGGGCNGNYFIIATPTATTITVANQFASTAVSHASGGTIIFQNGDSYTDGQAFTNLSSITNGTTNFNSVGSCPNAFKNHRGMTFTGSGWSNSYFNTHTFYFNFLGPDACTNAGAYFWELPSFSSATGGTAYIVPNNWYLRGVSWANNSEIGPPYIFASQIVGQLAGSAGDRQYGWASDPQYYDRGGAFGNSAYNAISLANNATFNNTDLGGVAGGVQGYLNSHWDYASTAIHQAATTYANLVMTRLARYHLQPRLNSPDYGPQFETTARTGSYGNILEILSFADNTESCTANLTPYLISGQPIIRYYASWSGITVATLAAGTTTDTITCEPGAFRGYVFANSEASQLQQPVISVGLTDVPSAAKVAVQYSYTPLAFSSSVSSLMRFMTFDCGTGTCTLPVDRQIGMVYYRLLFLSASGAVLATSDVQRL
jgi:Bacterial Ig domain